MFVIRELEKAEIETALQLALEVFDEFEAPDYSEQGVREFYKSVHDSAYISNLRVYGAFDENALVGTIATRSNGNHIALFFVSKKYQKQGIGKALFERVCNDNVGGRLTVNSSPFAIPVYHRLGFANLDTEQTTNGLRYTPMEFSL